MFQIFLNPWRLRLWALIQGQPYIFYDFIIGECLGLETCFRSFRARNISVSKLYAMTCGAIMKIYWSFRASQNQFSASTQFILKHFTLSKGTDISGA